MQRLIEIVAGCGNPVFDASGDWFPVVVNHAQSGIAMANFIRSDHSRGNQVIDLIEADSLTPQLFPDGIKAFDSSFHANEGNFGLAHLLFYARSHTTKESFIFRSAFLELLCQLAIIVGMKMTESQILEFAAEFTHTQSVRNWREDLHRLF